MKQGSHIASAVTELLAERDHLAARLQKVDTAIAAVRDAFHLPAPAAAVPRANGHRVPMEKPERKPNGKGRDELDNAIRTALRNGPLSPGELGTALGGVERVRLRRRVAHLEAGGVLAVTGVTMSRRVALVSATPAKEAP